MTGLPFTLAFGAMHPKDDLLGFTPTEVGALIVDTLLEDRPKTIYGHTPLQMVDSLRFAGRTVGLMFVQVGPMDRVMQLREAVPKLEKVAYCIGGDGEGLRYNHLTDDLLTTARNLRREVARATVEGAQPCLKRQLSMRLPQLKCCGPTTAVKSIWWDEVNRSWNFGWNRIGTNKMARLIAITLMRGEEWVYIGNIRVTVDYLYDMVRITGSFGGFVDNVDANFDPYAPPAVPAMQIVE